MISNLSNKKCTAFTLVELLVVLSILAMMAGIVLPSASMYLRRNTAENLAHRISILCREAFQRSIFTGRPLLVNYDNQKRELAVFADSKKEPAKLSNLFLRPINIPSNFTLFWPEKGWKVIPEGYCESSLVRIIDQVSSDVIVLKFRPYDARLESISAKGTN